MSYYPDEQNNQMIPTLDVNALTPRARNRLMQHMDQEGETAMKSTISLQRIVAVGNRAIVAYANVAQLGAQAAEAMPEEAERFGRIVDLAHQQICDIISGGGRY